MSDSTRVEELLLGVLPRNGVRSFAARDGVSECWEGAPETPEQAAEVLRLARAEGWTVLPLGCGSKLGWARPPQRVDLVLSSRRLSAVVAYEPEDGTLTALSGTRWSELVASTADRHHLSPEIPDADEATLGGVLVAGASGLDRLRHGPVRHQVLGMQALHADGTQVKSGGRVVKNVTGYDLHRLWCGSHGTLCFLLQATLRLYPAPETCALLRRSCADLREALARSHSMWRASLQPVAVVIHRVAGATDCDLHVLLAGRREAVAGEVEKARAHLEPQETLEGEDARRARRELVQAERPGGRWAPLSLSCRPSRLADGLERLLSATESLAAGTHLVIHPLLASASLTFANGECGDEQIARIEAALGDSEVSLRWRGLGSRTPPLRLPATASQLMQRLKQSLDPETVFVRGRFDESV